MKILSCREIHTWLPVPTFEEYMEERTFYDPHEKLWKEKNVKRDYLKELLTWQHKKELCELRFMAENNKKEQPKLYKKVRYLVPEKKRDYIEDIDVRDKMEGISLKDIIDAEWNPKWFRWSCKCQLPGHNDSTASFHIYEHTNTFYCFGCARGGTLIDFLKHNNKIEVKDAIKLIKKM